jgi:hypothetical protein
MVDKDNGDGYICDLCAMEYRSGDGYYGENSPNALHIGMDVCNDCTAKKDITNCGNCCGLFKCEDLDDDYTCRTCLDRIAKKKQLDLPNGEVNYPTENEMKSAVPLPSVEELFKFFSRAS